MNGDAVNEMRELRELPENGATGALAVKRRLSRQLVAALAESGLTKTALARRMRTSRSSLDRLLDPDNPALTLATLARAAGALGRRVRVELGDSAAPPGRFQG